MADQRKDYDPLQPNLDGGELNSEHEIDVAGMRGSTTDKSQWTEEDRKRSHDLGSMEAIRAQREKETGDPDQPTARHSSTTSMSEIDEGMLREGSAHARTPEEMSQHEELSEPIRPQRKAEAGEEKERRG